MPASHPLEAVIEEVVTEQHSARAVVWDTLWQRRSIGRVAVHVAPGEEHKTGAAAATEGRIPFHCPIMTGPFETANYLLGTAVLMEWVYTEPAVHHVQLDRVAKALGRITPFPRRPDAMPSPPTQIGR